MKKKLLIVLTFGMLLLGLGACDKKNDSGGGGGGAATYCYTCVATTTWTGLSSPKEPTKTTTESCGITEEGARTLEQTGTHTTTSGDVSRSTVVKCTRK